MVEIAATIAGDRGAPRPRPDISPLVDALADGSTTEAARLLAAAAGLPVAAGQAILTDPGGEPFAIALKATGMSRKNFAACLEKLRAKAAPQFAVGRDRASLQRLFDSLSYNKAKVLLTYWSWRFGSSGV